MALIDELKLRCDKLNYQLQDLAAKRDQMLHDHNVVWMERRDVELAIAALAPLAPAEAEETAEPVAEALTAEEVSEVQEFVSTLTGDPAIEPEAGLHSEPVDGYAPVQEPREETAPAQHPDAPFWAKMFVRDPVDA